MNLIKNWAVLAYAETFAKQKQVLAALQANSGQPENKAGATAAQEESKACETPRDPFDTAGLEEVASDAGVRDESRLVLGEASSKNEPDDS